MRTIALVISFVFSSIIYSQVNIIPQPAEMQVGNGTFTLKQPVGFIHGSNTPDQPVDYFKNYLKEYYNVTEFKEGSDVLTFQTDVLNEDLTLAGPVVANLAVSITGTDADFVVKIIDVFPDDFSYPGSTPQASRYPMNGYQMLVRGEIMRGKYRNSFETPAPFTPNKIEKVKFDLPDVAHTFKKGHRLMIQIQSSWFPLADRNPQKFVNIYEADITDFQKATIRIHHDAANSSHIILPVLK